MNHQSNMHNLTALRERRQKYVNYVTILISIIIPFCPNVRANESCVPCNFTYIYAHIKFVSSDVISVITGVPRRRLKLACGEARLQF